MIVLSLVVCLTLFVIVQSCWNIREERRIEREYREYKSFLDETWAKDLDNG